MEERENLLKIFQETKEAIKREDVLKLKELGNQTIHTASIVQDPDSIAVAIIVYSLSKIIERNYHKNSKWSDEIILIVENIIQDLQEDDTKLFRNDLQKIRHSINQFSKKLKVYIKEVFRKASINKASRIYEHGISMEKTAELLGISMYELADYAGQTGISDVLLGKTLDTKDRIKLAMDMFE